MKLSDDEILARIEQEEANAYGINDSELADERAKAISYYLGEKFGNEVEGRSQVVSFDVQDTIESALPQLLKVFVSGDQVVVFNPKGPEDQDAADQETEYINHLVMEKNPGFEIFYVWFKDALLSKNGYIKVYFEEEYETETENYRGLTDAQLQMLASDSNVQIVEHMMQQDPLTGETLHDVKIEVSETRGCIKIANVAPENIMVSVDTPSTCLQDSTFVQHREMKTPAELREQGFNVSDDIASDYDFYDEEESLARDLYSEDRTVDDNKVLVRDTYIKVDDKRMRYVVVGNKIIHKEEAEIVPFCCITPMIMPHRHVGRSYADLTMDIQLIKSTLIRGQLDNMYLANQPRFAISDRVNLEDMLTSRPGGIVRVQGEPGMAIMPLQSQPFPPTSFSMVEYMDSMKEKRTGVTAYNQGLDANSLNKTATGVNQIMQAAQQRLELVARTFAETGVKDLFKMVHRLVRMNYTKPDIVRLRNEWVEVDPRQWKTRTDLSISVGLGTGNKDQQLMHLMTILQVQREGLAIGITTPENIYNAVAKLTQNAGFKNPEEFWTNPAQQPPQPPQPTPEEIKIQGELQKTQMQIQADQQKFQAETVLKQQEAEKQLQQEMLRSQNDVAIEQQKIEAQMELERYKAQLDAEVELKKAQMQVQAQQAMKSMEVTAQPSVNVSAMDNQSSQAFIQTLQAMMEQQQANAQQSNDQLQMLMEAFTRPKTIIRGPDGRAVGVQ